MLIFCQAKGQGLGYLEIIWPGSANQMADLGHTVTN